MRAIRIDDPDVLRLVEVPRPLPAPDEVLIRIAFAGICHTDIEVLRASHGAYSSARASFPIVPGHEWSGWVCEVGADVTGVAVGDLVTGETGIGCGRCKLCAAGAHNCCPDVTETGIIGRDGGMREYHVQREAFVHKLGDMRPEHGALVEPASVAVYACERAGLRPGERVAVCGGGSIGQLCAQAARAMGARCVLLTSRSAPKLRLAEQCGVDRAVNVAEEDLMETAREVTGGELFEVVIEAAGAAPALDDAIRLAAPRGRVAVVGYAAAEPYGHSLAELIGVELSLIGVRGSPRVWRQTIDLMTRGAIDVEPMISHQFRFDEFEQAFSVAARGGPDVLKVLLEP